MAYNNGFSVNYPYPMYPQQAYNQQNTNGMSPPMIHADIAQVPGEQEAMNYPVAAGASQMMISRDEKEIYIKSAYPNSPATLKVYEERPPQAAQKPPNYVTREEVEEMIAKIKEAAE